MKHVPLNGFYTCFHLFLCIFNNLPDWTVARGYGTLAAMDERSQRIVKTAIDLAEEGGFEAVRLRDVAAHAKVALGTVYKRFRSKEDMLVAALALEVSQLEHLINVTPPTGETHAIIGYVGAQPKPRGRAHGSSDRVPRRCSQ